MFVALSPITGTRHRRLEGYGNQALTDKNKLRVSLPERIGMKKAYCGQFLNGFARSPL